MRRVSLVEFYRHKQVKVSVSRSSILVALAATVLLAALPGAIQRIVQTGHLYLFTQRFFEDVVARLSGAGRLRFILQPVAASLVGIRDGKSDAHGGRPAFLSALAFHGSCRLDLCEVHLPRFGIWSRSPLSWMSSRNCLFLRMFIQELHCCWVPC